MPPPDLQRFPRIDIVRPTPQDNPYNAWATKANVKGLQSNGILAGKTVVLKVCVMTCNPYLLADMEFNEGQYMSCWGSLRVWNESIFGLDT